ncbi:unnamed protein product [Paramecium octaurelia]|uniref:Uncharacterized protein n=1 Tax=Paramecium octaurelia TaxID=43137 RepID=A0A8S1WXT4_PAROT|nr:unnamed protein product [Paramecium octaurelia]
MQQLFINLYQLIERTLLNYKTTKNSDNLIASLAQQCYWEQLLFIFQQILR